MKGYQTTGPQGWPTAGPATSHPPYMINGNNGNNAGHPGSGAVSSGSGVLVFGGCCFLLFLGVVVLCVWVAVVVEGRPPPARNAARKGPWRLAGPGWRVSGIALATPEAPLTWEGRPRRLRAITYSHPHAQHQSVLDADAVGRTLFMVEEERGGVCSWGCRSSLRCAWWHGVLRQVRSVGVNQMGATRHSVGVMTCTIRVRPRSWGDHAPRRFRQRMCPSRSP
jgi:hypothetical protein